LSTIFEFAAVVIAGSWNRAIFMPAWLTPTLQVKGNIEIEVPVNNPNLPLRLGIEGFKLSANEQRLEIALDGPQTSRLPRLAEMLTTVVEALPHTPVQAVGWSFRFRTAAPQRDLVNVFSVRDSGKFADNEWRTVTTEVRRCFKKDGLELNVFLTLGANGEVISLFNYHHPIKSALEAVDYVRSHPPEILLSNAISLFETIYDEVVDQESTPTPTPTLSPTLTP
jgi:hypothetical protein